MSNTSNENDKEICETLSENKVKITAKCDEDVEIKVDDIEAPSKVIKDIAIDLKDKVFDNVSNATLKSFYDNQNMFIRKSFGHGRGFGGGKYDPERNSFILLVMIITLVMLLITAVWILLVFTVPALNNFFYKSSIFLIIGASVGLMAVYYVMICIPIARQPPCNFIMLILTVVFMCLIAAIVTCRFSTIILFYAFVATSAIVLVCVILACTSFDFTSFWLYFVVISVGFSVVAMCIMIGMLITGTYLKTAHIIILIISVALQSVGFVMELQMILGGKSIELDENDYAVGAFMLYTSIVKMFLNLVQIIGILND